jgi:hypothetical protein
MTGRHRKHATSAISVAKVAFTSAIIGGGGVALAGQASAAPAQQDAPQTWALHLALAPAPLDPYLREMWHEFHQNPNDVINGLLPQPTDPAASPPAGLAPGTQPPGPQEPPP